MNHHSNAHGGHSRVDVPWGMSGVALHLQPLKFEGAEGGRRAQGDQYTRTADRQSVGKVRCGIGDAFQHRDRSPRGRRVDGVKLRPRVWTPLTQECERRTRPLVPLPPRSSRIARVDPNPKHSTLADTHATAQTPGSTCCKPFSPDVGIAVKDWPGQIPGFSFPFRFFFYATTRTRLFWPALP